MADDEDVTTDILFVGLTRPAMVLGVPYIAVVGEVMASLIAFLAMGELKYFAIAIALHAVLFAIASHDPGIFSPLAVGMKVRGKLSRNWRFWGSYSCSPLPTRKWGK